MRAVGLDLGDRRIGVAISDSSGSVVTPYETVDRSGSTDRDHRKLAAIVEEVGAEVVVVGWPISMSGERGPQAQKIEAETDQLKAVLDVPVELHDERLTTAQAGRSLQAAGIGGAGKSKRAKRRKAIDQVAAAVLLESWLEER